MLSYTNFLNIMLETMSTTTQWGGKLKTQVDGYVGFDSIQEQIRLNSLKRGFEFNVMVVGKISIMLLVIVQSVSILLRWKLICTNVINKKVYNDTVIICLSLKTVKDY